jgi:hypothetical protein
VDATEFLDINVQQFAGASSLVALHRLKAKPAELAHPNPSQDPRDSRDRHSQRLSDFDPGHP